MLQGDGLVISYWSKVNTRFMSYVYDPVEGITDVTTFSTGARMRYITQHAFVVKSANVLPGSCKGNLTTTPTFLVNAAFL